MLDGLLGRGFSSKCKSLVKPTRARIAVLRKRQEATQKFLKGNLAQLLSNGLDTDAYGRTEDFIAGQNVLSCYDFIEHCCEYILKQLSLMQKQRECPEGCRESVGSLTFAAARFRDMPELRDLRDVFRERYGTGLEHFVNHEFVEKIASNSPTTEKKLQLLQDIALEFRINWDYRGFQRSMIEPDQHKRLNPISPDKYKFAIDKDKPSNSESKNVSNKELSHLDLDRNRMHSNSYKLHNTSNLTTPTRDSPVPSNNFNENIASERPSRGKEPEVQDNEPKSYDDNTTNGVSLNGKDVVSSSTSKNTVPPPPYIKPRDNHPMVPLPCTKPKEGNHGHDKGLSYYRDPPLPRPRSMRRKHSRSSNANGDEVTKESSSNKRRNGSNRDEEERMIDKLLLHYSRKPSNFDQEKLIKKAPDLSTTPTRSISLPREQTGGEEPTKVFARANSFQPDKPASHVHPKLPDYDELAARFAAFKGR